MKKTYFLDKIYNANFSEFENIIMAILEDLNQQSYSHTFFKKQNKWVLELERDNDLIAISFDDYSMYIYNNTTKKGAFYTSFWQRLFIKFLTKKQHVIYTKNIDQEEKEVGFFNCFRTDEEEIKNSINLG